MRRLPLLTMDLRDSSGFPSLARVASAVVPHGGTNKIFKSFSLAQLRVDDHHSIGGIIYTAKLKQLKKDLNTAFWEQASHWRERPLATVKDAPKSKANPCTGANPAGKNGVPPPTLALARSRALPETRRHGPTTLVVKFPAEDHAAVSAAAEVALAAMLASATVTEKRSAPSWWRGDKHACSAAAEVAMAAMLASATVAGKGSASSWWRDDKHASQVSLETMSSRAARSIGPKQRRPALRVSPIQHPHQRRPTGGVLAGE